MVASDAIAKPYDSRQLWYIHLMSNAGKSLDRNPRVVLWINIKEKRWFRQPHQNTTELFKSSVVPLCHSLATSPSNVFFLTVMESTLLKNNLTAYSRRLNSFEMQIGGIQFTALIFTTYNMPLPPEA